MPDAAVLRRAQTHVDAFDAAVTSGRWEVFALRFAADALLRFTNAPVPTAHGREAIVAAYQASPPDETMSVVDAYKDPAGPGLDVVRFAWASGALGIMRIRWEGGLVAELAVTFD